MCGPDMALFPPQLTALSLLWRRGPPPVPGCARCLRAARAASRAVEEARRPPARPPFLPSSEITQRAVFHEIILKTLTARSDSLPSTPLLYSYPKHFSCKWFTSLHLAGEKRHANAGPRAVNPRGGPAPDRQAPFLMRRDTPQPFGPRSPRLPRTRTGRSGGPLGSDDSHPTLQKPP